MDEKDLEMSKRKTLLFVETAKPYMDGSQVDTKVFTPALIHEINSILTILETNLITSTKEQKNTTVHQLALVAALQTLYVAGQARFVFWPDGSDDEYATEHWYIIEDAIIAIVNVVNKHFPNYIRFGPIKIITRGGKIITDWKYVFLEKNTFPEESPFYNDNSQITGTFLGYKYPGLSSDGKRGFHYWVTSSNLNENLWLWMGEEVVTEEDDPTATTSHLLQFIHAKMSNYNKINKLFGTFAFGELEDETENPKALHFLQAPNPKKSEFREIDLSDKLGWFPKAERRKRRDTLHNIANIQSTKKLLKQFNRIIYTRNTNYAFHFRNLLKSINRKILEDTNDDNTKLRDWIILCILDFSIHDRNIYIISEINNLGLTFSELFLFEIETKWLAELKFTTIEHVLSLVRRLFR